MKTNISRDDQFLTNVYLISRAGVRNHELPKYIVIKNSQKTYNYHGNDDIKFSLHTKATDFHLYLKPSSCYLPHNFSRVSTG